MSDARAIPERPEVFYTVATAGFPVVEKPLSGWEKLYVNGAVRKTLLLIILAVTWEVYARWLDNSLLVPTFSATVDAFIRSVASGALPQAAVYTISMLLKGYIAGLAIAAVLTALATSTRIGADLLETLTAEDRTAMGWASRGKPSKNRRSSSRSRVCTLIRSVKSASWVAVGSSP